MADSVLVEPDFALADLWLLEAVVDIGSSIVPGFVSIEVVDSHCSIDFPQGLGYFHPNSIDFDPSSIGFDPCSFDFVVDDHSNCFAEFVGRLVV